MASKIGNVSYRLELPTTSKGHPIFHVSLLKKVSGQHPIEAKFPADIGVEEKGCEPKKILLTLWSWRGDNRGLNLLVKWRGMLEEKATSMGETDFAPNSLLSALRTRLL